MAQALGFAQAVLTRARTTGFRACVSRRDERRFPDDARDGRLPRDVRSALRASRAHWARPWTTLSKEGERYVVTAGEQTFEAENVVVATGVMQKPFVPSFAPELDPRIRQLHSSDYRNLSQLQEGSVLVVGASHSGADIAFEAAVEHETILSGPDTGQIPASVETRRGRAGFRALFFVGSHVLTVDTPLGRKMRPHIRHGGAPLLRYRKRDLLAAGVERVLARTVGVQDGLPVLDDGRVVDVQNVDLVHRVPARLLVDPGSVRGRRGRLPGAVPRRRGLRSWPLLRGAALPALVHVDADRGTGRDAERVARHIAARPAKGAARWRVRRSECRAGRLVTERPPQRRARRREPNDATAILVWNGLVTRMRRAGSDKRNSTATRGQENPARQAETTAGPQGSRPLDSD